MSFRCALVTTDDNDQDLDLNQCVYLLGAWGGSVSSYIMGINIQSKFSAIIVLQHTAIDCGFYKLSFHPASL